MHPTNELPPLSDAEFLSQFASCDLPASYFNHTGHLRYAWLILRDQPLDDAIATICQGIQRYALALGAKDKFHHTLTVALVHLIQHRMTTRPHNDFAQFLDLNPDLRDAAIQVVHTHYSAEHLNTDTARHTLVAPDRRPLPETSSPPGASSPLEATASPGQTQTADVVQ